MSTVLQHGTEIKCLNHHNFTDLKKILGDTQAELLNTQTKLENEKSILLRFL